jgi:hypothetical protein
MRIRIAAMELAMAVMTAMPAAPPARAQAAPSDTRLAQAAQVVETPSQMRQRRPRVRIYREDERGVYPSYNPGPDAVRDCTATYVEEYRPSGTVIVPRMNCFWRRG